ncbi:hypothetical protein D3C77_514570 [compost metagenome]
MKLTDHFWKKAGADHRRQADADMPLFQIAQIIQFRGQIVEGGYDMLSLSSNDLPGVGQLYFFSLPVEQHYPKLGLHRFDRLADCWLRNK